MCLGDGSPLTPDLNPAGLQEMMRVCMWGVLFWIDGPERAGWGDFRTKTQKQQHKITVYRNYTSDVCPAHLPTKYINK